ncbi:hypothetical protein HK097_007106 [Rhizophlyctis rosea]|uniref:Cytochrome P450 n=1 Tax=Rhizophlyctis rosea TaxID=64517 RepID=A0AAD5SDL1_9FUNG|nr:hypothetical protein HK097_007106 [Rhizophlyctis rosea]
MPGTLSKLLEDLPVLNSLNPLVEIAAARLERWSPKDTGIVLAAAAAGGIALGYYYYSHLDPSLKQILTGKVDRGNVARQIQEKGPISQIYGISGHGYMVKEGRSYFFRLLFKGSILDKDNEEHTRTRRLLSSAFKSDSLRAYLPRMTSEIRSEFDLWVKMSQESGFVDLELELKQLALRFAFTLLVGADFTKDHSISTELVEKYEALLRGFIPWPIGKWDARKKSMEARQALVDDVTEIIRKRRKLLLEGVKPEFSDPLWLLMTTKDENGHSYTDEELADECVVLVIAGHETTARTLAAWTVELLRHPSLITALRKEQEDLVKSYPCDADNNYTNEHIKHMPLLDATFREIERMYGPAGEISRVTRNDITFVPADGGKPTVIKKGNRIAWSVTATNRDPAVYPEPNAFNPCRWLNSSLTSSPTLSKDQDSDLGAVKVSSFRLGTFGAGHRVCLGMQFARMEMLLIGGLMIKDYDFEDVDPECDLVEVGRPKFGYKDGIRVRFKRRA